ncbi:SusC/RagA family TonB-linked outer membrane protein [Flammeovirga yaeyamensis]|uniref:SusC/RagA family TonB-linked outer membrane protein n=1 Tax=Flammeovirga yaeyamensis TaxID=367791 RepID=A0AAX1NC78_9BACT|nr:SusC/RagA family TonB-linked outer membrane protein [Flammeovirga yaeyamensis]MBB3696882.1 TonB-linked SusC/RagA family outer membrane protein [Flammeovirga yaeyamensis]NMF33547.1 SusC/RagA family TonB-linked outer membrane protein [Flammeovirga yaeyamensis]QWG05184.1 SusC/RagA family TonB-linked outer membrane protein [Flammeovirga yaeyamensis]
MKYNKKIYTIALASLFTFMVGNVNAQDEIEIPVRETSNATERFKKTINSGVTGEIDNTFRKVSKDRFVGVANGIHGDDLSTSNEMNLSNTLQGRILGLQVTTNANTPGGGGASIYVRGKDRNDSNSPLFLVDGIDRPWQDLNPEEIDQVVVLRDATAKILYGSRAANGVVLITTKRGNASTGLHISGGFEFGMKTPTSTPEFLGADEYAQYYNQARLNDGLPTYYSDQQINAYRNGSDPLLNPNNDYRSFALKESATYQKGYLNFQGGTQKTKFFAHLGYTGDGGLEALGYQTTYERFNMRANVDIELSKWATLKTDVAGRAEFRNKPAISTADFYTDLSATRANEYPIFIQEGTNRENTILGGSLNHPKNIYGELNYGGYDIQNDKNIQTRMGFEFDFDDYVKGLSADVYASMDYNSMFRYGKNEGYNSYAVVMPQGDDYKYQLVNSGLKSDDQVRKASSDYYSNAFYGSINYDRTFNEIHQLLVTGVGYVQSTSDSQSFQVHKHLHSGLTANYMLNNKYVVEGSSVIVASNTLQNHNQSMWTYAGGLGWIVSNENFLKNNDVLTYLKLKGSAGVLAHNNSLNYYSEILRYGESGDARFGPTNNNRYPVWVPQAYGNEDLEYEKSVELNLGTELALFRNIYMEANVFRNARKDMPVYMNDFYPDYMGGNQMMMNYNSTLSNGLEVMVSYMKQLGHWHLGVSGNFMYQQTKWDEVLEFKYDENYLSQKGMPIGNIYGYRNLGFFQNAQDVESSTHQTFGPLRPGDIKYRDLNNDGVIDEDDKEFLGTTDPTMTFGIQLNIGYKNFNLFVHGTGLAGHYLNNSSMYYQFDGLMNYSEIARGAWTEATANEATYPALTTGQSTNNFQNSDFWLERGNFFRIKSVELSYTMPKKIVKKMAGIESTFTLRGNNLFEFTSIKNKNLDPERPNTGVTNFPIMRSVTLGAHFKF